jgi:hypothetical protein
MSKIVLAQNVVISAAIGFPMQLAKCTEWSIEVDATVNSVGAGTAAAAVAAAHTYQTSLVVTALLDANGDNGAAGNSITVAFTGGGVAGSEVVSVVGTAISVQIASGTSTITQVRTALNASALSNVLILASGTSSSTMTTAAAIALSGGANSKVSIPNDTITVTAHGMFTGQVVQLSSTGTLPTGLSTSTNYYVLAVDANTLAFYDTQAHAVAAFQTNGIPSPTGLINITADGTAGSTITITPTAISGCSYKLQKSNSYNPTTNPSAMFIDVVSAEAASVITNTITTSANSMASAFHASYDWGKVLFAISAGSILVSIYGYPKRTA